MSDGIFDPKVSIESLDGFEKKISDTINLEYKEYWLIGLLVLIIIGYYSYELFKETSKTRLDEINDEE
jgi:hypothetical protein